MALLSLQDTGRTIINAVKSSRPFSMVRLGDGEFMVIKYPKYASEIKCKNHIKRWFETKSLSVKQLKSISNQICKACKDADLLGVPSIREQRLYPKWKKFNSRLSEYGISENDKRYFHFYQLSALYMEGYLYKALNGLDKIHCITCRNIGEEIKKSFHIKNAEIYLIPPELYAYNVFAKKHNKNPNNYKHYPDLYNMFYKLFTKHSMKGKVFLVGAGGLGKIYCNWIKQAGGIALDIGALFDGWAGIYSRPYLKNPKRFKL